MAVSGGTGVNLDALANALRSEGFRRTPGSPRLITRLRRIKQLALDRNGTITFVDSSEPDASGKNQQAEVRTEHGAGDGSAPTEALASEVAAEHVPSGGEAAVLAAEGVTTPPDAEEATPGNEKEKRGSRPHRWQRYRRGGRRWRRPGGEAAAAPAPAS